MTVSSSFSINVSTDDSRKSDDGASNDLPRKLRSITVSLAAMVLSCVVNPVNAQAQQADFDCMIAPNSLSELGVQAQGVIDQILVDRGERVTAGQKLAVLKATVERANLDQALARVKMDSEIEARIADLEFTAQVLERQRSLLAQNLAPQQSVDEARARYRVAEAAMRRARDNAVLDRHELMRHEALYKQRFVFSPVDGVVVRRHASAGELVVDSPVLTVAELDRLKIEVVLPANELGQHQIGDTATITPETSLEVNHTATVSAIDPILDAGSGTFGIRLTLDNADGKIIAGQQCRMRFDAKPIAG